MHENLRKNELLKKGDKVYICRKCEKYEYEIFRELHEKGHEGKK